MHIVTADFVAVAAIMAAVDLVAVAATMVVVDLIVMVGIMMGVIGMEVSGLDQDLVGMDGVHGGVSPITRIIHIPLLLPSSILRPISRRHRNSRNRATGITAEILRAIIHMCNNVPEAG